MSQAAARPPVQDGTSSPVGAAEAPIDTADTVIHRPTGEIWTVCCVHDRAVYVCGMPGGPYRVAECELVRQATEDERLDLLKRLAASTMKGHRPEYARAALKGIA